MWAVMMPPSPVSLFELLQFLSLFVGKIDRDLLMRLRHDFMDAPASVAPYLLELRGRFIDNWRNFGDLFGCQTKLRAKSFFHSVAHSSWTVNFKEKMPSVPSAQSSASNSTSNEYKDKSGNKFPL
jgi:hypothetical protein